MPDSLRAIVLAALAGAAADPFGEVPTELDLVPQVSTPAADPPAAIPDAPSVRLVPFASGASSSGALALASLGPRRVAVVADADERRVTVVDLATGDVVLSAATPGIPAHVVIDPRGRIHATLRDADEVVTMDPSCVGVPCTPLLAIVARQPTPAEPIALAIVDDGDTRLVSCGRGRALVGHRLTDRGRTLEVALAAEPRGFVVDGDRVFVAHATGSRTSVVSLRQSAVEHERALHWRDRVTLDGMDLAAVSRFAVQGFAVALADDRVIVPMVVAYPGEPEEAPAGYGASIAGLTPFFPHEAALVEIDREGVGARLRLRKEVLRVESARHRHARDAYAADRPPCLLPRAVGVDAARDRVLVACEDLGRVVAYGLDDRPLERAQRSWQLGRGTSALVMDGDDAWAWSAFDRRLDRIDLASEGAAPVTTWVLPGSATELEGRIAFHTPRGFDGRSCASCHIDGRHDGLVWQSPNGMVQTPVLAGRLQSSAPYGWHAEESTLAGHMRRTISRLRAAPVDDATLAALERYLVTMPTYRGSSAQGDAQRRGRAVFHSAAASCDACHSDDAGTDGSAYPILGREPIDTPSLAMVADSAPYMHDGRHATLREVLAHTDGAMGHTAALGDRDVADLIAYLEVL